MENEAGFNSDFLKNGMSYAAIIFTIGLFSSGMLTLRKIHAAKSVGPTPYLPFVAAFINCCLWLMYGLIKPDFTITLVNTVGAIFQFFYILVYHTYVENKYKIRRDFSVAMGIILTVIIYYGVFVSNRSVIIPQLGLICNFFTICFFGSPLSTMADVVRTKSTESMSLPLSVMSVLTTFSWTSYGYLIQDRYVIFPNFIGLLLSIVQASLFAIYNQEKPKRSISLESPA